MHPWTGVLGMSNWEEALGNTQDTVEEECFFAGQGNHGVQLDELEEVTRAKEVLVSLLRLQPPRPNSGEKRFWTRQGDRSRWMCPSET